MGRESLLLSSYSLLREALGAEPDLTPSDDILESLRMVKSPAELDLMRKAAAIGAECMDAMLDAVEVGKSEGDPAAAGWSVAARRGAFPYDIEITSGPRSALLQWARMPSWDHERALADGDVVHIDLYGPAVEGYWTDFVRSTVVGRTPTKAQSSLLDGAVEHVHTIIDAIRPGITFGELWSVGNRWRRNNGFGDNDNDNDNDGAGLDAMFPAFGHCIGLGGGKPPYLTADSSGAVQENMVIAVETLLTRAGVGGAGFEQDVVVGTSGCEVLTERCPAKSWG